MCPQIPLPDSHLEANLAELETDESRDPTNLEELALALSSIPPRADPVKLVYETTSRFHANMPARYKLMVPVTLPHRLNPSIPGPPYYPPDNIVRHSDVHMTVLRPVLAGALHELLGADTPVESILGSGTPAANDPNMHFDGVEVADGEGGSGLETGYWRTTSGRDGYGIHAYWEDEDDEVFIAQWIVYQVDWRVEEADGTRPPIVQLKAERELEEGEVVFQVCEYPEWAWKHPFLRAFEASSLDDATRVRLERAGGQRQ
jgi:hypothetical protein